MIKVNELRIGNWVSNGEKIFTVDANVIYDTATLEYYPIEPIPLTPGILEKAGFKKESIDYYFLPIDEHSKIYYNGNELVISLSENEFEAYHHFPPCEYFHQLQNLYFALTGKELNISFL